jgi:tRNA-binding protein
VNVFYNREGIGDTLIISLKDVEREHRAFERKGDEVRIYDKRTGNTAGFNLFQASKYVDIHGNGQIKLTEALVEKIEEALAKNGIKEKWEADLTPKFVVGYVKAKEKHPNADKLSVCRVDIGTEELQIVCGAPNVEAGQKVVVAKAGAVMPSGLVIKEAELRGVASSGMICSARELGLPDAPEKKGILVLDEKYEAGQAFTF